MLRTKDGLEGNASTATILEIARTLTIGSTGKPFDGSSDISWSLSEIGAAASSHIHNYLPINGGTLTGQTAIMFSPGEHKAMFRLHTSIDENGIGDGNTHIGYDDGTGNFSHYFRGKGATYINTYGGCEVSANLVVRNNIYGGPAIYLGDDGNSDYKALFVKRYINSIQYTSEFGASYANNAKDLSSSSAITKYAAAIGVKYGSSANTVLVTENSIIPGWDNGSYCGISSHRFAAIHASTGTVYSSSKDEKNNITPINIQPLDVNSKSVKDIIKDGIKDTNIYSYSYNTLEDDSVFIGFIGQELEEQSPDFFRLIGQSYEKEENIKQYDIREASVIGVLWSGLQDALCEIDTLKEQINNIKNESSTMQ